MSRHLIPGRALLAVLLTVCWLALAPAPAARADDPVTLSRDGQITDKVGALGDRRPEVVTALDRLYAGHRLQLFVVYVRDFSGNSARDWADATADRNGLGRDDVLLAVATHARQYAYSADQDAPLSDARLRDVANTAIEPALKENDWAGAAIGAADGYAAVLSGEPVPTPAITPGAADPGAGSGGTSTGDLLLPVVLLCAVAAVAAYAFLRRKRRATTRTTPGTAGWGGGGPAPAPLPELDAKAKETLVATDDAVRTSEEELGFATAQFGEEAAAPFAEAVAYAKGELTTAFRLRQQLDDAFPEDDATRRRMLDEILSRCADADGRLDAVSEDFDRLRELEREAPQALAAAGTALGELTGRVPAAEAALASMRERYADQASAPVAGDAEEAGDRLAFATSSLDRARQAVDGGDHAAAAVYVRAAEGALDQAGTLVDGVERRARELDEAADRLTAALTELDTDLADAGGLLDGTARGTSTADLRGRIARARAVAGDVRAERGGRYDPIDALRRVEEADRALDEALAGARERERGDTRARSLLDGALLTARSSVAAAADFVTTHRGAVGSTARTRLAEAQRRLERAAALADTGDAQAALAEANRADALAGEARSLAEQDVHGYGYGYGGPGGLAGGGGGGMGGAVLGGILLGGLMGGGGGRGGFRGGFGGGGFGGGGGPGSFGGGGTRGRRGGGGRF
ncbi:TPM domain-containing protein [Streptomyces sp. 130]|nr:TPM domain-containing protein [Streptomyces sp. 130]